MTAKSQFTFPLLISAAVHIGVIVMLAIGVDFSAKPLPTPKSTSAPALQAVVVDQAKVAQQVEKIKQQKLERVRKEKARQAELDRQALQAKKKRELEQEKIKKLEQQRKRKEQETQQANDAAKAAKLKQQQEKAKAEKAEAARKQKENERKQAEVAAQKAADKRRQEEAAAQKAALERKRKEEERKRKAEEKAAAEAKRQAEERARQEQERLMQQELAAEQASLSATRNKQVTTEVQRYTAMIVATISRNVLKAESMKGKSCQVNLRLAPDGFVVSSKVKSGDQAVCRATLAAIQKVQRLPVSKEPDVYAKMKEINLTYRPEIN